MERPPGEPATAVAAGSGCSIRWLTREEELDAAAAEDDAKAGRYHAVRGLVVAVLLALLGWGGYEGHGTAASPRLAGSAARRQHGRSAGHRPGHGPVSPLARPAACATPTPRPRADNDRRKQLHASLALLPVDATQVDYLYGRLLDAEPHEVPVIRDALAPHKDALLDKLWAVVETPEKGKESQRLRAAAALAKYDPESEKWAKVQDGRWRTIWCGVPAVYLGHVDGGVSPGAGQAAGAAGRRSFETPIGRESERSLATNILADYAADQPHGAGRSADGRRREAVRRDLSEVQGARRAGPAGADRRDRQEAAARPAVLGRAPGEAGEAAGECGGGPAADEPAGEGLAAARSTAPIQGCGAI